MRQYLGILLAAVVCAGCGSNVPPTMGEAPEAVVDPRLGERIEEILTDATVAVRVIELPSRRELYAREADRPMMPASNMKLLTSATALDTFGPGHQFETKLAVAGDDLYLIGTGDPALGDPTIAGWSQKTPVDDFEVFAKALKARGMTRVKGNLYYDDRVLDEQRTSPVWNEMFWDYWYAAPVAGLNFNDNCVDVTVYPTKAGEPVRYEVVPPTKSLKVVNGCVTGAKNAATITRGAPYDYVLAGTCSTKTVLSSKPVEDPGYFTADALATYLAGQGVTIGGEIRRAAPGDAARAQVIATRPTPMGLLIKRLNKSSQNMFAEAMSKLCGREWARAQGRGDVRGSWADGEQAVKAFLAKVGVDGSALVAVDGSGLARENRVTARMLTELLAAMARHPSAEMFRQSLPEAGTDGTLRKRMPELKGRVFAKTGSIGGVRALSGYGTMADGRVVAFSVLCNEIKGDEDAYVKRMDRAVGVILGEGEKVAGGRRKSPWAFVR